MVGTTISHYRIIEKIGEGGMGVVYKAEDTRLKRPVALKWLPPDRTRDKEANERFIYEAQTASALDHQNICTIHEIDESDDGRTFICMVYYEGQTLRERIGPGIAGVKGPSPLPIEEAVDIALQIAQGLAKAHEKGIIHRDIKPGNIIVQNDGTIKIIDFGLSKLLGLQDITRSDSIMGSVAYLSPEQAQGKPVDNRSDIWSLGVALYEMLTGERPFKGDIDQAVIYTILNVEPLSITELRTDIPQMLAKVVDHALQKNPSDRYQNMEQILDDLRKLDTAKKSTEDVQFKLGAGKKAEKGRLPTISIFVISILLLALAVFFVKPLLFEPARRPGAKTIAIVAFENQTGDASFDYLQKAIPNLLITSLEQSDELRVATWERMYDILKQMRHENVALIDSELGFDLCRKAGIKTIVLGSFTKAGEVFVTDAKVLYVTTKELIKGVRSKGIGAASILDNQIDEISAGIAESVGLSEQEIRTVQKGIIDVTTSSIEAYKHYIRGTDELVKKNWLEASQFFTRAIEIDSTFAMAYIKLAAALGRVGRGRIEGRNARENAMMYAGRATEKERLFIEATYARRVEGDVEKWGGILKRMAKKYPSEKEAHSALGHYYGYRIKGLSAKAITEFKLALELDPYYANALWMLAYEYFFTREYEQALTYLERYAAVLPGAPDPVDCIAEAYFRMGRLDEAIAKYEEAMAMDDDWTNPLLWYCYALKENYAEAMTWIDRQIPAAQNVSYYWNAFYHAWLGNLEQSLSNLRKIEEDTGDNPWVNWLKGWIYYDRNELNLSRKYFESAYESWSESYPNLPASYTAFYNFQIGLVDLAQGSVDSANYRSAQIKKILPQLQGITKNSAEFCYHFLKVEVLLSEGKATEAITQIKSQVSQSVTDAEFGRQLRYNTPFLKDLLARAHYQNGELDKAIAEYKRLISLDPNSQDRYLIHPQYYYRLGRLYEEKGQKTLAAVRYEKFLELWKNADRDLPELIDAKFRLANLLEKTGAKSEPEHEQ